MTALIVILYAMNGLLAVALGYQSYVAAHWKRQYQQIPKDRQHWEDVRDATLYRRGFIRPSDTPDQHR